MGWYRFKCTFRRVVDNRLKLQWQEIIQLASTISFSDDDDSLGVFTLLNLFTKSLTLEV
jgi:hypothetical protein